MAEQIRRISDPPEKGSQIVAAQRQFNTRVRQSLNLVVELLNSLLRRGEIQRIGSWSIFGSPVGLELRAALADLDAAVAELECEAFDTREYFRALLRAWIVMGFPPPPGIPDPELSAALGSQG